MEDFKIEEEEGEVVNMAKGLQDWAEEERTEGRKEGRKEGKKEEKRMIIRNMLCHGMSEEEIIMLAECDRGLLEEVKKQIQ